MVFLECCNLRALSELLFKRRKEVEPMRMKAIGVVRATAQFIRRILDVQLPMAGAAGLRTH